MKILSLVWSIGIGGTERAAVNYAIGYRRFGNESRVLVLGEGHERYPDLLEAGVDTTLVSKSIKALNDIIIEFKAWAPDIIHVHHFSDALFVFVNLIKGKNTKVVETNVFSRPNYSNGYKAVDLSMQLSGWGYWKYSRLMKGTGYCPETAIVPYIVDCAKFKPPQVSEINSFLNLYDIPSNAFVIGRLGQCHESKWDIRLLEVIKHTIHKDNNIYYLLVGVPHKIAELLSEQPLFFRSRVKLISKIEGDNNLSIYYHSLSCFAHISKIGESFGYVLAEALLCKIPVITMITPLKDNAQFEVVGNNYGGYCVTRIHDFIDKIFLLYDDRIKLEALRNNLDVWIESRFSFESVIPTQLILFKRLLANNKIPKINVDNIINANFSLFKQKKWRLIITTKMVNHYLFHRILTTIRRKITSII